jgi:hypothetical protein
MTSGAVAAEGSGVVKRSETEPSGVRGDLRPWLGRGFASAVASAFLPTLEGRRGR